MDTIRGSCAAEVNAILDGLAVSAAEASGDASALLGVAAVIDGWCDRLAAVRLAVLRDAVLVGEPGLGVAERLHATNRMTRRTARADVRLARDLADRYPVVAQAWRDGTVSAQQARGIVAGLRQLPVALSPSQLEACQSDVVGFADQLDPEELQQVAERMAEVMDPERAEMLEAERVERDARIAHARRSLVVWADHHGSMVIRGQVPVTDGALFLSQLEALMPSAASYEATGEVPGPAARRADALVRLCNIAAASGRLPRLGGDRPQVLVTLGLDALLAGLGVRAVLGCGEPVTAGEARRLACDAGIIPVVLGGDCEVLDVGRTHRFFTPPIRTALVLRDQGCVFPGCDALPAACEAHHIRPWWAGGETCVGNGVMVCPFHHRLVEPDPDRSVQVQWQIMIDPDTGMPWFIPPRQIDPDRVPRLHHRFLLRGVSPPTPVRECATPKDLQPSPAWHG